MHNILVYSDSLSWGIIPDTRKRLEFNERWPGVLENNLNINSKQVRVIENCLNGRRTVWDDPFKSGRNGLESIQQIIEINSPLSLVILMLGTNDFQSMHNNNSWHSAQGIRSIINSIRTAPIEPEMTIPKILLVTPPILENPKGIIAPKFEGGNLKCEDLPKEYELVAENTKCFYFDSNSIIKVSKIDGVHIDKNEHKTLGNALTNIVENIIKGI